MKGYSRYFWFIHFIGDVFFINVAFLVMYYLKFDNLYFDDKYRFLIIIYNALWILVSLMLQLYELKQIKRLDRILLNLFKAFIFNTIILSAILFSLKASQFSREHLYATYLILFFLIFILNLFEKSFFKQKVGIKDIRFALPHLSPNPLIVP